ncbi:BMP-binding endothelial regulator protein-like [Ptychodera flava]|uniref:BMP-binding endothelial regulator protein-like n=1 Tax=Ptychodera flava TaxID=63121 RepID=UPI003969DEEA
MILSSVEPALKMKVFGLSLLVIAFVAVEKAHAVINISITNKKCLLVLIFSRSHDIDTTRNIHYHVTGPKIANKGTAVMSPLVKEEEVEIDFSTSHVDYVILTVTVTVKNETGQTLQTMEKEITMPKCGNLTHDPHITTFDGRRYTYQGLCWHTLVKDCSGNTPRFEVLGKFEPRDPLDREVRSRTTDLTVIIGGQVIEMDRNNDVKVNGRKMPPEFELLEGDLHIAVDNTKEHYTALNIKDTFEFSWNGAEHAFDAAIERDNQVRLCGLLGDADGDPTNDLTMRSGSVTKDVDEFGKAGKWIT